MQNEFMPPLKSAGAQDETLDLRPKFNADGLIPIIAQEAETGQVLMLAWMNAVSLALTLKTRQVTYWSRSRQSLWRKGETSGHVQHLVEILTDCDQDTLLLRVLQTGPACHTHRRSCFYRKIEDGRLRVVSSSEDARN